MWLIFLSSINNPAWANQSPLPSLINPAQANQANLSAWSVMLSQIRLTIPAWSILLRKIWQTSQPDQSCSGNQANEGNSWEVNAPALAQEGWYFLGASAWPFIWKDFPPNWFKAEQDAAELSANSDANHNCTNFSWFFLADIFPNKDDLRDGFNKKTRILSISCG